MKNLRNIAIIAHVDHGKTTLVDRILHQSKLFRENEVVRDLILDSNDLERERGITILSKNVSVQYKGTKINIIDTPGHSDFGGEVERVLNMADGVLLLVDAFEGPMPQTRFVLQKALQLKLKPIVVINKVDKPNCSPDEVQEAVFDLMYSLDGNEAQLNFPTVYGSSKQGWMGPDFLQPTEDISYLLDVILDYVNPPIEQEGTLQMRISSIDYSSYVGRIAVGKITRGKLKAGMTISVVKRDKTVLKSQIKEVFLFQGLEKRKTKEEVVSGEICALIGPENFDIGDTIADHDEPEGLPPVVVDEPTMSMLFTINTSPFYGQEGEYVTSRHIRERLYKETEKDLALRVEDTDSPERLMVYGRGVLHLSILVETMRREGYEFQLGQPQVLIKEIDGVKQEPVERLTVQIPEMFAGKAIEIVTRRKGEIVSIITKEDRQLIEFKIPARGLIGLSNALMTVSEGEAIVAHQLIGYEPWKGELGNKRNGSLVAMETGTALAYSIDKLQDRGKFFILPVDKVYVGQVIGEHNRQNDLVVNVTKGKKLTNVRASGSDDKVLLAPPIKFSLEEAMEYINEDEYLEITPRSIRMRKILLDEHERKRQAKSQ
ncbi:MAG: translational GTPase TypA [Bacteroidota bacterium]